MIHPTTRTLASVRLLAGIVFGVAWCVAAEAAATPCNRECLRGFVTQFLDALVEHDPGRLVVSSNVRFTQNSVEMKLGEGLWKTASRLRSYRQDILDVRAGVAGSHVVLEEGKAPIMLVVRLKVVDRRIAEIETMTVRNVEEGAIFDIDALQSASPAMTFVPTARQLPSREEAIRIANFYPMGLKVGSFVKVDAPFSDDAYRLENGHLMAGPGCTFRAQCDNIKTQPSPERPSLASRLIAVDEQLGIVWYQLSWNRPASDAQGPRPGQLVVWEMFKVYGGLMHAVEAFIKVAPNGYVSGWD